MILKTQIRPSVRASERQSVRLRLLSYALTLNALTLLTFFADAQSYMVTNGSGTTSCRLLIPGVPGQSARIVGACVTSDKAGSVLDLRTSDLTTTITVTNASTSSTALIVTTNWGFTNGNSIVMQTTNGVCYFSSVASTNNGTNIVLNTGGFGAVQAVGSEVSLLGSALTLKIGNLTASYQGQILFIGNRGRPICATLDGTSACSIDSLAIRYDQ